MDDFTSLLRNFLLSSSATLILLYYNVENLNSQLRFFHSTYTERRSASETAIKVCYFICLIALSPLQIPTHKAPKCNYSVQLIKCECSKLDINNIFFLGEISQIGSY